MTKQIQILLATLLAGAALWTGGCGAAQPASQEASQEVSSQAAQAQGPAAPVEVYHPQYAKGFTIEYYEGGAKVIATQIPATANTMAFSQRVLVVPQGAPKPQVEADYVLEEPLERVITYASSHAGHFALLEKTDLIVGTSIKQESCYIPALSAAMEAGTAQYVGSGEKGDKELIASLRPQIVTIGGMKTDTDVAAKLEESGIFCLYFGDFAEESYLGRAEWLVLAGALCGQEDKAKAIMEENQKAVETIIQRAAAIEKKPKVLWFTHYSQPPHWGVRTSADYVNSMVADLGAQMLYPQGVTENSVKLSNEDFLPLMLEADRIVFGVSLNSYPEAKDITFFSKEGQIDFTKSPAYQADQCYVVGYDWAQDTANVKSIMEALAVALYPEEFSDLPAGGKIMKFKV